MAYHSLGERPPLAFLTLKYIVMKMREVTNQDSFVHIRDQGLTGFKYYQHRVEELSYSRLPM